MSDEPRRRLVVDASVVVKWYVPEVDSEVAGAILRGDAELLAPELLLAEMGNLLWKKVRRGELEVDEGEAIIDEFLASAPVDCLPHAPYLAAAYGISTRLGCTVYDALYISVALTEQATVTTADARLVERASGTGLRAAVVVLAEC